MADNGVDIVCVRDDTEAEQARTLARAFKAWNYRHMPDLKPAIDRYFSSQNFERHLANILSECNPPEGECLLARLDGKPVGIVTLKRRTATEAEMNRMFVLEAARGRGIARALATNIIARALTLGYRAVLLNALDRLTAAIALYRSLGFADDVRVDHPDIIEEVNLRLDLT